MTYHPMENGGADHSEDGSFKSWSDKARAGAHRVSEDARDAARSAEETARDAVFYGRYHVAAAQSEIERGIQRNPGLAVLGALGVGVILGLSLRQARR